MSRIIMHGRWKSDDGRSWDYDGPSALRVDQAPDDVLDAVRSGTVVSDMALKFDISADGERIIITTKDMR